jgi:hypothetical protein
MLTKFVFGPMTNCSRPESLRRLLFTTEYYTEKLDFYFEDHKKARL